MPDLIMNDGQIILPLINTFTEITSKLDQIQAIKLYKILNNYKMKDSGDQLNASNPNDSSRERIII